VWTLERFAIAVLELATDLHAHGPASDAVRAAIETIGALTEHPLGDHCPPARSHAALGPLLGSVTPACAGCAILAVVAAALCPALSLESLSLKSLAFAPLGALERTLALGFCLLLSTPLLAALLEAFADALAELLTPLGALRAVLLLDGFVVLLCALMVRLGGDRACRRQREGGC
jgi:hypothetical protein